MADPNVDIVIDCADPETLADFWAEAMGCTKAGMFDPYFVLLAPTREHPPVILPRVPEPKRTKARIHFDLRVDDIETEARRLEQLGARRIACRHSLRPRWERPRQTKRSFLKCRWIVIASAMEPGPRRATPRRAWRLT